MEFLEKCRVEEKGREGARERGECRMFTVRKVLEMGLEH